MTKGTRITARILALLLLLLLAGLVVIQSPRVQTAAGKWAIGKLQDKLDADIRFKMVSLRPFDALVLEDFALLDRAPQVAGTDTILQARSLYATFSLRSLLTRSGVRVNSLHWKGGQVNVVLEDVPGIPGATLTNIERILRIPYQESDGEMHWGMLVKGRDLEISDFRVSVLMPGESARMAQEGITVEPGVIDWNDLHIYVEQLKVKNYQVADDLITARVEQLRAQETVTGLTIREGRARHVRVGKQRLKIDDLVLEENESHLDISCLQLDGPLGEYGDFTDRISLDITIRPATTLALHTLSHFGPGLQDNRFRGRLKGRVRGPVRELFLEGVAIQDLDNGVILQTSGPITGLPDITHTQLDLHVGELGFQLGGLGGFVQAWAPDTRLDLNGLARGEQFHFNGQVSGRIDQLQVKGDIQSRLGGLSADVTLQNVVDQRDPLRIGGRIRTRELHLGKLLGVDALGPLDLQSGLEASFPEDSGMQVRIDSLHISRLNALGYDYSGISAVGTYSESAFDGRIIAADPNLNFLFQGLFNLSPHSRYAAYRFYASLGYADLHALHLDPREQSKLSFQASSNFIRTERQDLLGEINLYDLRLQSDSGPHEIGDISIRAHTNDNLHRVRFKSGFLDGNFVGDHSLGDFVNDLQALVLQRDLPALLENEPRPWAGGNYELLLNFKDVQDLLDFLAPGMYVEKGSQAQVLIENSGLVTANVRSGRIALLDKYIKDFNLHFDNDGGTQQAVLTGSVVSLSGARILGSHLKLFADDNRIGLGYTFDNGEEEETHAELYLTGELERDDDGLAVYAQALPSNLYYKGNGWGLSSGEIYYQKGRLGIEQLQARHEDELLLVEGGYSATGTDTLRVVMEKFDIGLLNTFDGEIPPLEGKATGQAVVVSPASPMPGLLASIAIDSTRVAGERMGQVQLSSIWNDEAGRFDAFVRNRLDGRQNLDLNLWLHPGRNYLHAEARTEGLNLAYAAPYLSSVFSDFRGGLSGLVTVDGPLNKLELGSKDLRLNDGRLTLDYTQCAYRADGPLELDSQGLHFKRVQLSDGEGGQGVLYGSVLFDDLRDLSLSLDTHISVQEMQVLNLPRGLNPTLFGQVYGTGQVDVTGPLSKILIDINASTARSGELHIPLSSGRSDSDRQLLTFKQPDQEQELDPYERMMAANQKSKKSSTDLDVRLRVRATPDVRAYIDVDEESSLNATGSGNIELESTSTTFSLGGHYDISEGSFHFSVMNLVTRDFAIQEGSTVRFNGGVYDTDLDVKGVYVTKASLANLISDETAVNRRTVNCGIHITGRLQNPEVDFSIDVPDLNPTTQAMVDGALNTDDKIQKQFVYLLIAGNFLPSEESGITSGGTDVLFSNVSSIMSGQLNNIFQKLNIPLDLGLNYQATQTGSNIFDVALSTQLFNNRVIVNGSVGNKQQYGSTSANQVAGDVDIEIKLNSSGSLRLNLFSHSADDLTSYLDNSQRNGGGITLQKEFNTLRQFFYELFHPRSASTAPLSSTRNTTLQIDALGNATPQDDLR